MREEAVLFLKKKNQKDFFYAGPVAVAATAPQAESHKSFCVAFFKKRLL
jgi:hypothetical protein